MQLVGARCGVCAESIKFAPDAGQCPSCEIAFHTACLRIDQCPKCNGNYADMLRARESQAATAVARQVEAGRRIILFCGGTLLAIQLVAAALGYLAFGVTSLLSEGLRTLLLGSVILAMHNGFRWARRWLQLVTLIGILASFRMVQLGLKTEFVLPVFLAALLLVGYAAAFTCITFSRRVARYMDSWPSRGEKMQT